MQDHGLEDELVERLAEMNGDGARAFDPTLDAISAEIDSLSEALRTPPEANPFASEPELAKAIERASSIARETPPEPTRSDVSSTGVAEERQPVYLGQYELQEKLGSGGMGTVYRAVHRKLNRTVALKVLPPDRFQTPDAVARFEREMRAVGMLQHPNIVAAHDAGEVDECHFLVMELVEGEDIGHLLSQTGPLPIAEACEIVRQAALGLQHIAENGLVHRDIKPSNLMLATPRNRKGEPTVKILDLGLALLDPDQRGAARELTSTGQVMGTIDYMAPEQGLDTHSVDIRADLYSLGATLYKLLTGRAPLEDPRCNTMMKRLIALERNHPSLLTSLRPDCPVELSDFIHRLLSKSPDERPEQPQTVADVLAPFAQGADLRALQHGMAETLNRWIVANPEVPTVTTTPQSPTQISKPRPTADDQPPGPPRPARRWLLAAALPVALLLGVLIYVVTDTGQITIEAPDDLKDAVSVSVLRNGAPAVDNWRIEPGPNAHRIRSGTVEVKLAASVDDAFELQPLGDLIVKRGGEVKYRLTRRKLDSAVVTTPSNGGPPKTSSSAIVSLPAPIQIDEPPPLEDWLKGRTVLTVAQDGSGQFRTIQTALDALQPGQVVKVLDKGPYRERLDVRSPPDDTGLISNQQAVIELSEWNYAIDPAPVGHIIRFPHGFRLHGFVMTADEPTTKPNTLSYGLQFNQPEQFVLEQCSLQFSSVKGLGIVVGAAWWNPDADTRVSVIRDCDFGGGLTLNSLGKGKVGIIRNWFHGQSYAHVSIADKNYDLLLIRENVFAGKPATKDIVLSLVADNRIDSFEISNNTFLSSELLDFWYSAPQGKLRVVNNLRQSPGLIKLSGDAVRDLSRVSQEWGVGHNSFPRQATVGEQVSVTEGFYPRAATDVLVAPTFLANDPSDREYLRLSADTPLATAGAGGDVPNYVGALSPGPAPKDGDWFTRLRERRGVLKPTAVNGAGPVRIDELPPLEQWLKGRTILTVAQDGSGQFQTIQAALDSLQPGQVVEVLDRGPYHETMVVRPPEDTGLVSRQPLGTMLVQNGPAKNVKDPRGVHQIVGGNGFRLSGFEFKSAASEPIPEYHRLLEISGIQNAVVEQCFFQGMEGNQYNLIAFGVAEETTCTIRECRFDWRLGINTGDGAEKCTVTVLRCWFPPASTDIRIEIQGSHGVIVLRNNIIETGANALLLNGAKLQTLELASNSFVAGAGIRAALYVPLSGVTICNNVLDGQVYFNPDVVSQLKDAVRGWRVHANAYTASPIALDSFPKSPDDIVVFDENEWSPQPADPDSLRPRKGTKLATRGSGGEWPTYIGALPPGPAPTNGDWFTRLRERWLIEPLK